MTIKKLRDKKWKLIVEYEGEEVKDKNAKIGELEVIEFGAGQVTLIVNNKDVSNLVNDKRRTKLRRIIDDAMYDIKSEFEMDNWEKL